MEQAYKLLGVSHGVTDEELKKKYRELAKTLHPDTNKLKDSGAKFRAMQDAYDLLKDKERRRQYEDEGKQRNNMNESDLDTILQYRVGRRVQFEFVDISLAEAFRGTSRGLLNIPPKVSNGQIISLGPLRRFEVRINLPINYRLQNNDILLHIHHATGKIGQKIKFVDFLDRTVTTTLTGYSNKIINKGFGLGLDGDFIITIAIPNPKREESLQGAYSTFKNHRSWC
jgi:curved DNA-binding protein CbpA